MSVRTEREKMLAGEPYLAGDPELRGERLRARRLCSLYNATAPDAQEQRQELLRDLLGAVGADVEIEPPFFCDYGSNVKLGSGVFLNFGCVVLDCNRVVIGDRSLLGPGVHIYAAYHPVDPAARSTGRELAAPVVVGSNGWIGGQAIVCPGVTIGDNTTVGAGSVVVKSLPANVVAAGNPCRVLRSLEQ